MIQSSIHITGVNGLENLLTGQGPLDSVSVQDFAACKKGVVETLAYFDIFHYPLTSEEIRQFSGYHDHCEHIFFCKHRR